MLPKAQRLQARQDFQKVYRRGRSWAHPLLALHLLPEPMGRRVGVSVSKKVGKAVVRNRVRRRIREILRAHLPGWHEGVAGVVVARAAASEASYAELEGALVELARRARLPREPGAPPDTLYTMPQARGESSRNRGRLAGAANASADDR